MPPGHEQLLFTVGHPLVIIKVQAAQTHHKKKTKQNKTIFKEEKNLSYLFRNSLIDEKQTLYKIKCVNNGVSLMAKHLSRLKMQWNALFRAPKVNIFPREVPSLIQWNGDSPLHTSPRMRTRFELIYCRQPNVFSFFFKFSGEPWKTAKRLSGRVLDPVRKVAAQKVHFNCHNLSEILVTISNLDLQFMTSF